MKKLSEPGQETQIDFTGKIHNKNSNGELQVLIALDRFSKGPTVTKNQYKLLKIDNSEHGRRKKINPEREPSATGNVFYNTYGNENNTV